MATCIDKDPTQLVDFTVATGTPTTDGSNGAGAIGCSGTFGTPPRLLTNSNTACTPALS